MGEHKERMLRNDWYLDEPDLVDDRRRCWRLLDRFNATGADDDDERETLLRRIAGRLGDGVVVLPPDRVLVAGNPARPVRQI